MLFIAKANSQSLEILDQNSFSMVKDWYSFPLLEFIKLKNFKLCEREIVLAKNYKKWTKVYKVVIKVHILVYYVLFLFL